MSDDAFLSQRLRGLLSYSKGSAGPLDLLGLAKLALEEESERLAATDRVERRTDAAGSAGRQDGGSPDLEQRLWARGSAFEGEARDTSPGDMTHPDQVPAWTAEGGFPGILGLAEIASAIASLPVVWSIGSAASTSRFTQGLEMLPQEYIPSWNGSDELLDSGNASLPSESELQGGSPAVTAGTQADEYFTSVVSSSHDSHDVAGAGSSSSTAATQVDPGRGDMTSVAPNGHLADDVIHDDYRLVGTVEGNLVLETALPAAVTFSSEAETSRLPSAVSAAQSLNASPAVLATADADQASATLSTPIGIGVDMATVSFAPSRTSFEDGEFSSTRGSGTEGSRTDAPASTAILDGLATPRSEVQSTKSDSLDTSGTSPTLEDETGLSTDVPKVTSTELEISAPETPAPVPKPPEPSSPMLTTPEPAAPVLVTLETPAPEPAPPALVMFEPATPDAPSAPSKLPTTRVEPGVPAGMPETTPATPVLTISAPTPADTSTASGKPPTAGGESSVSTGMAYDTPPATALLAPGGVLSASPLATTTHGDGSSAGTASAAPRAAMATEATPDASLGRGEAAATATPDEASVGTIGNFMPGPADLDPLAPSKVVPVLPGMPDANAPDKAVATESLAVVDTTATAQAAGALDEKAEASWLQPTNPQSTNVQADHPAEQDLDAQGPIEVVVEYAASDDVDYDLPGPGMPPDLAALLLASPIFQGSPSGEPDQALAPQAVGQHPSLHSLPATDDADDVQVIDTFGPDASFLPGQLRPALSIFSTDDGSAGHVAGPIDNANDY